MSDDTIQLEVDGAVATITLNRPERLNAIADNMRSRLMECLKAAEQEPEVRVLVVTGAGRAFCSGGDIEFLGRMLQEKRYDDLQALLEEAGRFVRAFHASRLPTLAAINGVAAGAGLNLALSCDMRIASKTAKFAESFVKVGLHPDWAGTFFLPRLIGPSRAMRMMMTGETIDAAVALDWGLVDEVVEPDDLMKAVGTLAARLAAGPPQLLARIKQAVYMGHDSDLSTMITFEETAQQMCFKSADAQEGLKAFLEKRAPAFTGS